MAGYLNFTGDNQMTAAEQIVKLYNLFIAVDATQVDYSFTCVSLRLNEAFSG